MLRPKATLTSSVGMSSLIIFRRTACLKWKRQPTIVASGNWSLTAMMMACSKSQVTVAASRYILVAIVANWNACQNVQSGSHVDKTYMAGT